MRNRNVLFVVLVAAAVFPRILPCKLPDAVAHRNAESVAYEPPARLDDTFVYDVVARYNEELVASVDAIDTALMTILAGSVAVLVFTIDKINELARAESACAIALTCTSTLLCVIAYTAGFPIRSSKRDGVRPRLVVPDMVDRPKKALADAILQLINAGERNLTIRFMKKGLAVLALVLLLAGVVLAAVARANGFVVN